MSLSRLRVRVRARDLLVAECNGSISLETDKQASSVLAVESRGSSLDRVEGVMLALSAAKMLQKGIKGSKAAQTNAACEIVHGEESAAGPGVVGRWCCRGESPLWMFVGALFYSTALRTCELPTFLG